MSWTEIRFDEVTHTVQHKIRCFGCDRRLSRQRTFRATLNPWNLNEQGEPKSRSEIRVDLKRQAARWNPQGVCAACMRTGRYVLLPDGNFADRAQGGADG